MSAAKNFLPKCPGPKLGPFEFQNPSVQTFEVLSYLGSGLHSEVFKVKMEGKIYALKAFRFYRADMVISPDILGHDSVTAKQVMNHKGPFNAECRAYGRLQETGRTDLAIKCFGHLLLTKAQEKSLESFGGNPEGWNRRDNQLNEPLQCIVKEYIDSKTFFTRQMFISMKKTVKALNRLGILIFDLRKENYLDGIIIDFSQAHTVPHLELDLDAPWVSSSIVGDLSKYDLVAFDDMVDEWNELHPDEMVYLRFARSRDFCRKLRSAQYLDPRFSSGRKVQYQILRYNWNGRPPTRKQHKKSTLKAKRRVR